MRIATSPDHAVKIDKVPYRQSLEMMIEAGFDGADFSMCRWQTEPDKQLSPEWMQDVRDRAKAHRETGFPIAQCHLPYLGGHIERPGDGGYNDCEAFILPGLVNALNACGEIGCTIAVMHPFFHTMSRAVTREGNLRLIEKLMPLLEKNGVKLALENIYGPNYSDIGVSRPEDILAVIQAVDSPLVGACIDTGHANIFSLNTADMARLYGDKLFALHVNGNAGKDEHVIPMSMSSWCEKMDFYAFSQALTDIGFDGYYNLEIACGDLPKGVAQAFLNYAAAVAGAMAGKT